MNKILLTPSKATPSLTTTKKPKRSKQRKNLHFLGLPESMTDEEDMKEVIYQLLERELCIEELRKIGYFQRIHRIGKNSNEIRPIIARFLHFQDREYILKVLVDLPKVIRDRRMMQWPKMKKAREEGKTRYFSWGGPDKLISLESLFQCK